MKKIFFLILFLITLKCDAQFFREGFDQIKFDSLSIIPDTIGGDVNFVQVDSNWVKLLFSGGGGSDPLKLNISDTAAMLSPYAELFELALKLSLSDTAFMLSHYAELSELALKLNINDTATMLSHYAELAELALKLNLSDTANMLANYAELAELATKLNTSDTATMLINYAELAELLLKVNISDTATMLAPYVEFSELPDKVDSINRIVDSVYYYIDGTQHFAFIDSTGSTSGAVPNSRNLTINGTTFDLSADRTWSVGTVTPSSADNFTNKTGNISQWTNDAGYLTSTGITPAALTKTDDANVTLTLGGTPSTALLQATSLTLGWSGQLSIARGGLALGSLGTANQLLRVNAGATALEYFTSSFGSGTVTNVSALTLGTTGTDLSSSVANGTTTPVITLNVPTASASNRGALSSTDWSTFNSKQATISVTTPITLTGASVGMVNQGTTTTVLHGNAAGNPAFSSVVEGDLGLTDITTANASTSLHGFQAKGTGSTSTFYRSDNTQVAVTDANLSTSDITTNDVSSSKHGFAPKGDGTTTKFLNANGAYSTPASGSLTVGTTTIASGTTTRILYDNAGVLGEYTISGSGNVAMTTSPSFTTPVLGTPTSGTLTNTTGYLLNNIAAATGTNTIDNLVSKQEWQWSTLAGTDAFKLSSTSTAAASNAQTLLNIALSGANPTTQTTYGLQVANTHTGTASSNVAGYFTASGGTNNYGLIVNAGSVGIGTTAPTSPLHLVKTISTTSSSSGTLFDYTGAGTPAIQFGLVVNMQAGYTGSGINEAISTNNYSAGTGADMFNSIASAVGNVGVIQASRGTSNGDNVGCYGWAANGLRNIGVMGGAELQQKNSASAVSMGVYGTALRANSSAIQLGGYFGLGSTAPTFASAALMCDNGSQTSDIFVARDNGSAVLTIADGGGITTTSTLAVGTFLTCGTNAANLWIGGAQTVTSSSAATYLPTGSTDLRLRVGIRGSTNPTITAAASYGSFVIGDNAVTEAASGTHPLIAQQIIKSLTITNGAGATTDATTLYIEGAPTGITPTNPATALWVAGGIARFGGVAVHESTIRMKGYTVATLPAGVVGDIAYVTDALAPAFLAVLVGGGAVKTPCFYDGTNWVGF